MKLLISFPCSYFLPVHFGRIYDRIYTCEVLSLCQGGKEGRLYMSPLAAREVSGAPPGSYL